MLFLCSKNEFSSGLACVYSLLLFSGQAMARPGVWLLLSLLALLGPGEAKRNPFRSVSPVAMKPEDFVKPPDTRDELMIGRFTTKLLRPQQSESVSVIVTSKNIGHLVIDTLESVRTSLLYILHETTSLSVIVTVHPPQSTLTFNIKPEGGRYRSRRCISR